MESKSCSEIVLPESKYALDNSFNVNPEQILNAIKNSSYVFINKSRQAGKQYTIDQILQKL